MSKFLPIARDICGCAGMALIVTGINIFSHAAALIVTGTVMVATAAWLARRG
jgi:hypothetical protein